MRCVSWHSWPYNEREHSMNEQQDRAEAAAERRLREKADAFYQDLESAFYEALPGNHSPSEALFLAHLMTAVDGYKDVHLARKWANRPKDGWVTSLVYLPELESGLLATFCFECRNGPNFRNLAIIIDAIKPGERLPKKMEQEKLLTSLNFRVMVFTEPEILANPEECRERVEQVLSEMIEEILVKS